MFKNTTNISNWQIVDNMRGMFVGSDDKQLVANSSNAESDNGLMSPTATGFIWNPSAASNTYIYIAIRRGPMKVPTSGTSVFSPNAETPSGSASYVMNSSSGFPVDMFLYKARNNAETPYLTNRLTNNYLQTASTAAEAAYTYGYDLMQGVRGQFTATSQVDYAFRRAPSFFDEVCYTGINPNGYVDLTINHNLGVAPEIIIIKRRSTATSDNNWYCGWNMNSSTYMEVILNTSDAGTLYSYSNWFPSPPTSTTFQVSFQGGNVNQNGATYVAYLFATCPAVSKVGSYTGNGSSQTIDCGFTGGARFVLIKKSSGTGDWMVSDSARGIVSGNDPYLELNNTNAEVTGEDWLDTNSTGFVVNEVSGSNANTNGASYIFLAIA
jgi:hypothetical protein